MCYHNKEVSMETEDKRDAMLIDEIKTRFSDPRNNQSHRLSIPNEYAAWSIRIADWFGVAIEYEGPMINEEFYSASISKEDLKINGEYKSLLILKSTNDKLRAEFAIICSDFVDPGIGGEKRKKLLENPLEWFSVWKELLGNSLREKMPYSVIGELLTYYFLTKEGLDPCWSGPDASSHDFTSRSLDAEVKSTIKRIGYKVHIANEFQLNSSLDKELELFFYRFEVNAGGLSINKVVNALVDLGVDYSTINKGLNKLGYKEGSHFRNEEYKLHEALQYKVDNSFPRIDCKSFKGDVIPKDVETISYDLNIESLPKISIIDCFEQLY